MSFSEGVNSWDFSHMDQDGCDVHLLGGRELDREEGFGEERGGKGTWVDIGSTCDPWGRLY
jgi:hypothetical protein